MFKDVDLVSVKTDWSGYIHLPIRLDKQLANIVARSLTFDVSNEIGHYDSGAKGFLSGFKSIPHS